jgi:hypothetical protein
MHDSSLWKKNLVNIRECNIVFFESCPSNIRDLFSTDVMGLSTPFESLGRQMALSREVHYIHQFGIMVPHK